jgi:hypothetical protein
MRRHARRIDHRLSQEVTVDVPVQYFQSVIALETAITGVLLFQIRFFATGKDAPEESDVDPVLPRCNAMREPSSAIRTTGSLCSASYCTR